MAQKKKMYVQAMTTKDDCGGRGSIVMVAMENKHDHKCMGNVTNVVGAWECTFRQQWKQWYEWVVLASWCSWGKL